MITHNRSNEVLRSLDHLTRLPEDPRIVVVDNGTIDGTAEAVAERFPRVEVLRPGRNLGAAGRTLGARHVDAPYLAFCDDDTWWEPGALSRIADLFDAHPRLAVIAGRILVGPEGREDLICAEMEHSPLPDEPGLPGSPLMGFLAGCSVVRRAAYLEVGGFEPWLFFCGEEEFLAADFAAAGWAMRYVSEVVVHHYPSAARDAHRRRWLGIRNTLWFAWLRRPLPSALRRTWLMARTVPRDRVSLRGFAAALAGLPWVVRRRRVVPPEVEHRLRLLDLPQMASKARRYVS
jgi:GT2 family glycosyltransferase